MSRSSFMPTMPAHLAVPHGSDTAPTEGSDRSAPGASLDRGTLRILADRVARAALSGQAEQLDAALATLRREDRAAVRAVGAPAEDSPLRAALLALSEVTAAFAAHRAVHEPAVRAGTELARLLTAVGRQPGASNEELTALTGLSESAVSRTGRRAIRDGLATPTKYGRINSWQLSELGERAVDALAAAQPAEPALKAPTKAPATPARKAPARPRIQHKPPAKVPLKKLAKAAALRGDKIAAVLAGQGKAGDVTIKKGKVVKQGAAKAAKAAAPKRSA